jgi:hypothetical protein
MRMAVLTGRRMAPMLVVLVVGLIGSVAATGCGGGEAEAALTKAQFRKKANLICNKAGTEQYGLASEYFTSHPGADEAEAVEPALLPPLESELRELQALSVPAAYEGQIKGFLRALEEGLQAGKKDPQGLLSKQNNPFDKANALSKRYQLGDCSLNP